MTSIVISPKQQRCHHHCQRLRLHDVVDVGCGEWRMMRRRGWRRSWVKRKKSEAEVERDVTTVPANYWSRQKSPSVQNHTPDNKCVATHHQEEQPGQRRGSCTQKKNHKTPNALLLPSTSIPLRLTNQSQNHGKSFRRTEREQQQKAVKRS